MRAGDDPPYHGPRHAWRVALLARALLAQAPDDGPLLDAGCGHGTLALRLACAGRQVLAFDRDPGRVRFTRALAERRGRAGQVQAFVADLAAVPLAEGSVAGIACGEVLEHLREDRPALRELARVVAPGGLVALTVPAGAGRLGATDRAAGHARRYDEADLAERLAGADLRTLTLRGWGFPFGRLYDRLVLAPAQAARGRPAGRRLARLARWRPVDAFWRALFALDERLPAGRRGSGWLAVARRPVAAGLPQSPAPSAEGRS